MTFTVSIEDARSLHPEYEFVAALTPSAQKAAFHVRQNGTDYCLKIISPNQALDRVQREVLAMQSLDHPNVVKVLEYEYSAREGLAKHYLVEEFIDGTDLSELMIEGVAWELQQLVSVFSGLCDGLSALEAQRIVHRDLKPSNIRIRPNGSPVIIDFGLARMLDMASLTGTFEGAMIGTPKYFSPEQFRGNKRDIDHRTDLYSVGVLVYEAAVGEHPSFNAQMTTMDQLSEAVCLSDSFIQKEAFTELPEKLRLLVSRLLSKERGKRPPNAELVGRLLRELGET